MRNLLDFFVKYNHWFLFLLLEALSAILLFRYNRYQGSVWFSSANMVVGKVYEIDAAVTSYFSLAKLNARLTQENLKLEHELEDVSQQLADLRKDSLAIRKNLGTLLDDFRLIPAKVVSNSIDRPDNLMTIDKGAADGVKTDMAVACGTGVVGNVYMVSEHYSVVIPLLSSQSHVSCAIKGRGYFGYMRWNGRSPELAYVDDIPRHAKFRLGEEVVTSGYSSMFPPGILVGRILHVFNSPDGLSYRLQVKLSTDFGNLRDVCVIDDTTMKERLELLRAAQDSIQVKDRK